MPHIRSLRLPAVALGVGGLLLTLAAVPADGAGTTVGSTFTPANQTCQSGTYLQSMSMGNSYTVPSNGVITSWSFKPGAALPTSVGFRLGRTAGSDFSVVGAGPSNAPVTAGVTLTQNVRIPAKTGDYLGLYVGGSTGHCLQPAVATTSQFSPGDFGTGSTLISPLANPFQLDVSATLEPDADGDGFGDVTQDLCPTSAMTQASCTPAAAPDTTITGTKVTNKKTTKSGVTKAKVKVSFTSPTAGATFQCSVDGAAFTACASPLTVKVSTAKHGKKKVAVRAVNAGVVDPTPATVKAKVKK